MISCENNKNNQNHRIPGENYENHENLRIQCQNNENHEIYKSPRRIMKIMKIIEFQ